MTIIDTDSHGNPTVYMSDGFFFKNYKVFVEYDYPEPGTKGLIDAQVVRIEYEDGHVTEWPRRFIPKSTTLPDVSDHVSHTERGNEPNAWSEKLLAGKEIA